MVATASTAPAAPMRWPIMDFVEFTLSYKRFKKEKRYFSSFIHKRKGTQIRDMLFRETMSDYQKQYGRNNPKLMDHSS